ncbi:MAG: PKD domain-containing protein, partial [Chitinophagia bacterium]|nr:PKD domain-containing protein [Chitinophagia bacterium]
MALFTRTLLITFLIALFSTGAFAVTADFTADYTTGCAPLVVHFHNTSSGAASYSWDLGNGTTSALTDVSGSYLTAGTYTVTLTATSSSGATDVKTMVITVNPAPTVSFYADDTAVCPGTCVNFTSTSTSGVSGCAMTYLWNFGDGSSSTLAAPCHAYGTPGSFHVTLTVTNCMGCATTLTRTAYIT